jgi:hypothetical protein
MQNNKNNQKLVALVALPEKDRAFLLQQRGSTCGMSRLLTDKNR